MHGKSFYSVQIDIRESALIFNYRAHCILYLYMVYINVYVMCCMHNVKSILLEFRSANDKMNANCKIENRNKKKEMEKELHRKNMLIGVDE